MSKPIEYPSRDDYRNPRTPFAVVCPVHALVYLSRREYGRQMRMPDARWICPICGALSVFDDDNYDDCVDDWMAHNPDYPNMDEGDW